MNITFEQISERAYQIYLLRGETSDPVANWFEAQAQLQREAMLQEAKESQEGQVDKKD
jgi:hypothetical protein